MQRLLAIQDLCVRLDRGTVTRSDFADRCAALVAAHIGCSAVAFWLLLDTDAGPLAQALGKTSAGARWGLTMHAPCPRFAASLRTEGAVIAQDARAHAATARFFDIAPPESLVRSLLAVPFSINGQLFGAFVCAQFDQAVRWSAAQVGSLRSIGLNISPPLARATSFTMSARPRHPPPPLWGLRPTESAWLEIDVP